jgi:hypothetical protein
MNINILIITLIAFGYSALTAAGNIVVKDVTGNIVENVMVSQTLVSEFTIDRSDNGYPPNGIVNRSTATYSQFTGNDGRVSFDTFNNEKVRYRLRKPGYKDQTIELMGSSIWRFIRVSTNSSFPSWHIEDAQPTLIVLKPSLK